MVHDTPPYGHAPIPNIIDLSQKKLLFDLKVKGQGPAKVIMVCNTPPYGHAPTYQISLTYLERNHYLTLGSKIKVKMVHNTPLMVMHPHTKYHWPISKDKKCYGQNKKTLFENNYLTLRSKVKFQQRSLWYATHPLMDMHPHTKYHWPILKEQIFDLEVKGQVPTKFIMVCDTPPYGHAPIHQISLTYLERRNKYLTLRSKDKFPRSSLWYATHRLMVMHPHTKYHWPILKEETNIWPWGQRTSSHEVHYGMRHTALWSCTHTKYHWPISKDKNGMARTTK